MPAAPRITLEQWQALVAVVDAGSYARAADRLHKTQSTVTYAVQRIESLLGVKAFQVEGRKAVLTATGQLLYRRARVLLDEAAITEAAAQRLSAGWEAEIRIAMEHVFPTAVMLECLDRFSRESPHTHIELVESVMGGTTETLLRGEADIAIAAVVPTGFLGEPLLRMRLTAVAHPDHPLHRLGRAATHQDLRAHRQLVVRESSSTRSTRPIVEATQRWTVSHAATSIRAARMGYGYAWLPEDKMREEMAAGMLKPLPLAAGRERYVELYLIIARRDCAGPGIMRLAEIIQQTVPQACEREASARLVADRVASDSGEADLSAPARSAHRPSARPRRARAQRAG